MTTPRTGWWTDHVLPRIMDRACGVGPFTELRKRVCAGLHGDVVEVGFGSGLNVEHYPEAVTSVAAVDPSELGWRLAQRRLTTRPGLVRRAGLDGERLVLDDAAYDCVLSTFTLCSIPDLDVAMHEVLRVLRPGGRMHFLEHGLAPDPAVRTWQRRLTPIQRRVAGGCHLNRPIDAHVERSGLTVEALETFYMEGPKVTGHVYLGRAVKIPAG